MRIFTGVEPGPWSPWWENEFPLAKGEPFPLEDFPLIDDFEIVLERSSGTSLGYRLAFFGEERGYIAHFPWWDHVELDLYRPSFTIPFYDYMDEGWEIGIFSDEEYMYVLERDFDYPDSESGYQGWFKVRKDHYLEEWQSAIKASYEIVYLANKEYNERKNKR